MKLHLSFSRLSDAGLTDELTRLVADERHATARVVACLEEFDRRRLYLGYGFSSLFAYCTEKLHMSEDAACRRIAVARAIRLHPGMLEMLRDGRLSITTAGLLVQKVSRDLIAAMLPKAAYKSKRQVEVLIATAQPLPPVPSLVRKLPEATAAPARQPENPQAGEVIVPLTKLVASVVRPVPVSQRPVVVPLSESHYKLQVTISAAARERLGQIQDLMRHKLPNGDPAAIVEQPLEVLHAELLKKKAAEVARPRGARASVQAKGRHIPASVRRAVWRRDQGRCAFVAETGRRCGATSALEFHHVNPHAHGGKATVANIEMRCRAHNGFEWSRDVGEKCESAAAAPPA